MCCGVGGIIPCGCRGSSVRGGTWRQQAEEAVGIVGRLATLSTKVNKLGKTRASFLTVKQPEPETAGGTTVFFTTVRRQCPLRGHVPNTQMVLACMQVPLAHILGVSLG